MDPLERARSVQQEAASLMHDIALYEVLEPYGPVVPTGSYYLDVMVHPDVDLYIPELSLDRVFGIGRQFADAEKVYQVTVLKLDMVGVPSLPEGLYLGLRVMAGAGYRDWGHMWKFDIVSFGQALVRERMAVMAHFRERMTASLREQIVRYKCSILNDRGRTPSHSGFFVYEAFIDKGLSDPADVTRYLADNGIDVEG